MQTKKFKSFPEKEVPRKVSSHGPIIDMAGR